MYEGTIKRVFADRGFAFIAIAGQPDLFVHVKDVDTSLPFDETLTERRVRFSIKTTPKGPQAAGVVAA